MHRRSDLEHVQGMLTVFGFGWILSMLLTWGLFMFSISNLQKHIEYQDAVITELSLRVIEAEEQTTVAVQHCDYVVKAVIEKEW